MSKIAIITGASSGIGAATAARFMSLGHQTINISRRPCPVDGVINISADLATTSGSEAAASAAVGADGVRVAGVFANGDTRTRTVSGRSPLSYNASSAAWRSASHCLPTMQRAATAVASSLPVRMASCSATQDIAPEQSQTGALVREGVYERFLPQMRRKGIQMKDFLKQRNTVRQKARTHQR